MVLTAHFSESFSGEENSGDVVVIPSADMTLQFTSDASVVERGFRVIIHSFPPGACPGQHECSDGDCVSLSWECDGVADCSDGKDEEECGSGCGGLAEILQQMYLTSPSYPEKYSNGLECEWRIRTRNESKVVSLGFIDFHTESTHDKVSIYDGIGRNKTIRGVHSGYIQPFNFVSTVSSVTLLFTSDGSVSYRGFNISITFVDKGMCPGQFTCLEQECLDLSKVCDGKTDCRNGLDELHCPSGCGGERELTEKYGFITSQSYPGYYSDNLRCEWRIYGKQRELIQLDFDDFDTEQDFDKLLLFGGSLGARKNYVGYVSGRRSGTFFRSRSHQMTLVFLTDGSTTRSGFNISYRVAAPQYLNACPGNSKVVAFGMQSGEIKDSQITASSSRRGNWKPSSARLHNAHGAWASRKTSSRPIKSKLNKQWIQVDLLRNRLVTGLITQGFTINTTEFFVRSFTVAYRKDRRRWRMYTEGVKREVQVFTGNTDGQAPYGIKLNHPITARYIRIIPRIWTGRYIFLRIEILGCDTSRGISLDDDDCGNDDLQCGDGTCVRRELACDGNFDCNDRSDEDDCEKCRSFQIKCTSGECVLRDKRCDGEKDCSDGSDEIGCSRCHGSDFLCSDESNCLARKLVCDGYKDCADFSDERNCSLPRLCSAYTDYKCGDGSCVAGINARCNGYVDCPDGSDEAECDCGISPKGDTMIRAENLTRIRRETSFIRVPRIVGGLPAQEGSWPWQVSLENSTTMDHFCGGALISTTMVVTAAHCLSGKKPSDVLLKFGQHYRTKGVKYYRAAKTVFVHPRYDDSTYDFDIALIELNSTVRLNSQVKTICLPPISHVFHEGQSCWISGWGTVSAGGRRPEILQEARVELLSNEHCNKPMWYAGKITSRMLCSGDSAGGVDACQGDSGGPLMCKEKGGHWFLAGVVSWGIGCGLAYKPGVYARITELAHWIEEIMSNMNGM